MLIPAAAGRILSSKDMYRWMGIGAAAATAAIAVLLVLAPPAPAKPTPQYVRTAIAQLASLVTHTAGTMKGYSRDRFGDPWEDVDHNGCDTRNDILRRDLKQLTFKLGSLCLIIGGTLRDSYTGRTIPFVRGPRTSSAIQIDHVVALGDAWRTGAAKWVAAKRLAYANDPYVLLAVDGPSNSAKGDSDAAEWLPDKHVCRYVSRQIGIKAKYGLWVTMPERRAMQAALGRC